MGEKKDFFTRDVTGGEYNALYKALAQQMEVDDAKDVQDGIMSGAWVVTRQRKWWRQGDVFILEVVTDGESGEAVARSERVGSIAQTLVLSGDYRPSAGGQKRRIAILPGVLFSDADRITQKIRAEADRRRLGEPNAEVSRLIQKYLASEDLEEMGLARIVPMHQPIKDSGGAPGVLGVPRSVDGLWLGACYADPDGRWHRGAGFAFVVS
jgi:hypothetical protein